MGRLVVAAAVVSVVSGCAASRSATTTRGVEHVNPPGVAPPVARYSQLSIVPADAEFLFLAGQLGVDREGKLPPTPEEQLRQALANVKAILESAGGRVEDVVKVNFWVVRPIDRAAFRDAWVAFVGDAPPPPTTLVYVTALARPEYLVELDVTAARRPDANPSVP